MTASLSYLGDFPTTRLRRNRQQDWSRNLIQETRLSPDDFILPLFIREEALEKNIPSLPGVSRLSLSEIDDVIKKASTLGIPAVMLFPAISPQKRDKNGTEAFKKNNLICQAVARIKNLNADIGVIVDVALDPYTSHGHDGIVLAEDVDNDLTLEALTKQALTLARAGVDAISPSDMMDGRIGIIRNALDENGFKSVKILSYAAKYASSFYGPFRDAVGSQATLGTKGKKTYQLDPANALEALREVALDVKEGADMLIVKPGLPYLDIIYRVKQEFGLPTLAYQVSGEYALLKAGASKGLIDEQKAFFETLLCLKRAGADAIISYAACDVIEKLL